MTLAVLSQAFALVFDPYVLWVIVALVSAMVVYVIAWYRQVD